MGEQLSPSDVEFHACELRARYDTALFHLLDQPHSNLVQSPQETRFGDDDNFILFKNGSPTKLHVIAGRVPHHGESDEKDPQAFHAWEVVIETGSMNKISYSAHEWKSNKAEKVYRSLSGGIQDNTMIALQGAEELLTHFKKAH